MTFNDVKERLKQVDEISILEILEITSDELVERFIDKIEDKIDFLEEELEGDYENK